MAYDKPTVMAAQNGINSLGYSPALVADGVEGPKTDAGVVWARNNGASVDGEANSLAKLTDGFLLAMGIAPGGHVMGTAASTVQKAPTPSGSGQWTPAPAGPQAPLAQNVFFGPAPGSGGSAKPTGGGGSPLNVKPPLPSPIPAPAASKAPTLPAILGAAVGGVLGFFAGGPAAAAAGAGIGGGAGYFFGKKSGGTFGEEDEFGCDAAMMGEGPTHRYFTASLVALAHTPALYYKYAPAPVINAASTWAAASLTSPGVTSPVFRMGVWELRRRGASATLFGPPYSSQSAQPRT